MFRWILAGIVLLAVVGALGLSELVTRDDRLEGATAAAVLDDPPWIAGSRMPRVKDGVATILAHCGQAAPCEGTATLADVSVPYRIAPGGEARLRFAIARSGRTRLTWRETTGTVKYDSVTLRPS
jgi:hypothetical protein